DPVAFIALALVGVGNTLVDVAGITMLQRAVDDKVLARVMGVLETSLITTIGLGAALAPLLVHLLGARGALIATGAVLPVATAIAWPRLRMLERIGGPPIELVELLRSARLFAPLPEATIEHLARRLVRVEQQPGEVVIRQGEPGDRYYLIQSGELDADVDGQHARRMGPGAGFGEIALLRDVPRTATVTAVTECVLYALERDEFIPAVTGSAPATAEADALASARLAAFSPGFLKA
ncbi:MAG: cyclic nucleotide-binding domain-containing protein, partial [Thermoleophilaceae bacterium]